jgi:hypothetical protein
VRRVCDYRTTHLSTWKPSRCLACSKTRSLLQLFVRLPCRPKGDGLHECQMHCSCRARIPIAGQPRIIQVLEPLPVCSPVLARFSIGSGPVVVARTEGTAAVCCSHFPLRWRDRHVRARRREPKAGPGDWRRTIHRRRIATNDYTAMLHSSCISSQEPSHEQAWFDINFSLRNHPWGTHRCSNHIEFKYATPKLGYKK